MKYALLIYARTVEESERPSEQEQRSLLGEYMALAREPGVLAAEQLEPPESATTVRVQDGRTLTTDGPFADTKEFLGGLYMLEADDLDRVASREMRQRTRVSPSWPQKVTVSPASRVNASSVKTSVRLSVMPSTSRRARADDS